MSAANEDLSLLSRLFSFRKSTIPLGDSPGPSLPLACISH